MKRVSTILKNVPQVENFKPANGNDVPNQFKIITGDAVIFQSYSSVIAVKMNDGRVLLDEKTWDYSRTTSKYRNDFLGNSKKECLELIESGYYILTNLNK